MPRPTPKGTVELQVVPATKITFDDISGRHSPMMPVTPDSSSHSFSNNNEDTNTDDDSSYDSYSYSYSYSQSKTGSTMTDYESSNSELSDLSDEDNQEFNTDRNDNQKQQRELITARNEIRKKYPRSMFISKSDVGEEFKLRGIMDTDEGSALGDIDRLRKKPYEYRPDTCLNHNSQVVFFGGSNSGGSGSGEGEDNNNNKEPLCCYCEKYINYHSTKDRNDNDGFVSVEGRLERENVEDKEIDRRRDIAMKKLPNYKRRLDEIESSLEEAIQRKQNIEKELNELTRNHKLVNDQFTNEFEKDGRMVSMKSLLEECKTKINTGSLYEMLKKEVENLIDFYNPNETLKRLSNIKTEIKTLERDRREILIIMRMLKVVALTKSWPMIAHRSTRVAHIYLDYLNMFDDNCDDNE